ncbi:MAG: low-specificity L-threonine aldolase [Vicinamibacterales bacterium]|jgi:threonine aldolase|nr:low-specificity L-threonine aldolase [Vicinamibacterales bacterium]
MRIDLRSDTVTVPTPAMRQSMADAEVGDDVFGDDPTVNRLETLAAETTGKEAAVFVASGTMGNLASLLAHCGRGRDVILGDESHIYHYENGGASALGGLVFRPVRTNADGTLPLDALRAAIHLPAHNYHYYHYTRPGVICLENTHNRCGGRIVSPEHFAKVAAIAAEHQLPIHLDGARLFNAAVAAGRPVADWTRHVSSVQLCLSKGLSAPVGSLICGSAAFVDEARRMRKILGGGMRQAGVIAAPGIIALTEMVGRLADDHRNARILADGIAALPGVVLDPPEVDTNIVVFRMPAVAQAEALEEALGRAGVLVSNFGGGRLRVVTHDGITEADCRAAVDVMARVWEDTCGT